MSIIVTSEMLQRRMMPGGVYDTMIQAKIGNNPTSLARVDLGVHFKKVDGFKDSEKFVSPDRRECTFNFIGQIAPGYVAHPVGSYTGNSDEGFAPITDSTCVKDSIPLIAPTSAPPRINAIFHNQVVTLLSGHTKRFAKASEPNGRADTIFAVTKPLYVVSKDTPIPRCKVNIDDIDDGHNNNVNPHASGSNIPPPAAPHVGDLYPCSVLPGYGGPWFNHSSSKAVQLNIRNPEGNLILPQDTYRWLVPGTIVLVHATMHVYCVNRITVYQLTASSIQVIDKGDVIPPTPVILDLPERRGKEEEGNATDSTASSTVVNFTGLMNGSPVASSSTGDQDHKRSNEDLPFDLVLDTPGNEDIAMSGGDEKLKKVAGKKAKKDM
ncbi:hypothetical protein FB446DRAFT_708848 [Lentinula raphanica]|nr:hypothetical protein FB446DRAFT_708848 [Lentinula raphanica]